ncbi:MAG: Asp23/Gls24 family envelope stress response protein [Antricoccus sp.]
MTKDGQITVAQGVVQKIAGIACREITGVHAMGGGASRAFGAIKERIPGSSGPNVAQGVGVEVGETQAAIDLASWWSTGSASLILVSQSRPT